MQRTLYSLLAISLGVIVVSVPLRAQAGGSLTTVDSLFTTMQWKPAIAGYRAYLKSNAGDGWAWFKLGFSLHNIGEYREAINAYDQAYTVGKFPVAVYNIACAYAKLDEREKAFTWLEKSVEAGFSQPKLIETDDDLKALRDDARFSKAVKGATANAFPCTASESYRQLDFWVGDWDVFTPSGQPAGSNSITRLTGDCAILETWSGATGGAGHSINAYNSATGKWQQVWVGANGMILEFSGTVAGGVMKLEAETKSKAGATILHRMSLTKLTDDKLRQVWEQSTDGGKVWTTTFEGAYVRRKS